MKKRVLAGILMMVLVLASAMSVSAANSREEDDAYESDGTGSYHFDSSEGAFSEYNSTVQGTIKELEQNKTTALGTDIQNKLAGKTLICDVFDLRAIGSHPNCTEYHAVTMTVPGLTSKCTEVVVLHYSSVRGWEILEPVSRDGNKITVHFEDLSPVAVYAKVTQGGGSQGGTQGGTQGGSQGGTTGGATSGTTGGATSGTTGGATSGTTGGTTSGTLDNATGTSPSTEGTSSAWMIVTAMALVVLGTSVVSQKKKYE